MNTYEKFKALIHPRGSYMLDQGVLLQHDPAKQEMYFSHRGDKLLTLDHNGVFTLHVVNYDNPCLGRYNMVLTYFRTRPSSADHRRVETVEPYYVWVGCDRTRHRNYKNYFRVGTRHNDNRARNQSVGFVEGLRVKNGVILNPEISPDYKRAINRAKSKEVRAQMQFFSDYVRSAAHFNGALGVPESELFAGLTTGYWFNSHWRKEVWALLDLNNPTPEAALAVLRVGFTRLDWGFVHNVSPKVVLAKAITSGLEWLRKDLYEQHGVYEWVKV